MREYSTHYISQQGLPSFPGYLVTEEQDLENMRILATNSVLPGSKNRRNRQQQRNK